MPDLVRRRRATAAIAPCRFRAASRRGGAGRRNMMWFGEGHGAKTSANSGPFRPPSQSPGRAERATTASISAKGAAASARRARGSGMTRRRPASTPAALRMMKASRIQPLFAAGWRVGLARRPRRRGQRLAHALAQRPLGIGAGCTDAAPCRPRRRRTRAHPAPRRARLRRPEPPLRPGGAHRGHGPSHREARPRRLHPLPVAGEPQAV